MAHSRFKAATKADLQTLLEQQIKTSGSYFDSKLSEERRKVLDYYNAKLPKPLHDGNSKYVSMDVFDAVESMKAVLLETFSAGNRIVEFEPQNEDDVPMANAATEYCDYIVFRQNDGYGTFGDIIFDGLMSRAGVAKVYWEENIEEVEEEFTQLTGDEVDMLLGAPDISLDDIEMDKATELFSGTVLRTVNKSKVRIDPIAPEEFLITPNATSIDEAPFVAHMTRKTYSDLIQEGYDKKKIERIKAADEKADNPEHLARHSETGGDGVVLDGEMQEQTRYVMVYECYVHLDMEGNGIARLYKVTMAGNEILDHEQAERKPFIPFVPLPQSHSFYGSNYAARVIPTQNARTVLVRGILDHTVITNNPRYQVLKGGLTNPREMLENRLGGLVNVNRPDAIAPLPQAGLNPFVFQTIGLLDEDKEEVTGMSRLSTGMNKDAVSKQNSEALVDNLVSLSQQRQKIIARNFAQFVKRLWLEVYRLAIANERTEKMIAISGEYQRIAPWTWDERTDCTVELKLGYGEQEKEAQKFMMLHQTLAQDPKAQRFYTEGNAFNMYKKIFDRSGCKDISAYITDPQKLGKPQPDPMAMKQMELEERKVAAQEAVSQASMQKVQGNLELEQMRIELQRMKEEINAMVQNRTMDIKEFDSTSKAAIAAEELQMAKALPDEQTKAIVSPNS